MTSPIPFKGMLGGIFQISPDLDLNCLQRLSTEDIDKENVELKFFLPKKKSNY